MNIKIDLSTSGIVSDVRAMLAEDCEAAKAKLWSGKEDFTGWVSLPEKLICDTENAGTEGAACCSSISDCDAAGCIGQASQLQAELAAFVAETYPDAQGLTSMDYATGASTGLKTQQTLTFEG